MFMASNEKKPYSQPDSAKEELIHKFKANPGIFIGTIVVLVIVIVAFVFVPAIVPGAVGSNVDLTFGTYDKTPITYVPGGYFAQIRENIVRNQQNSGADLNNMFMNYQIWRAAFEQTVVHTAVLEEMKKAKYEVPDVVVDKTVAGLPQFQENGKFSSVRYRQMDSTSRAALWREIQAELTEARYRNDVTGLKIASKEADFVKAMASPQRTFDMAAFSLSSYPDSEVIAYAAANSARFQVTHLSKISLKSEKEAQQILQIVQDGTSTFEDAAKTYSQDTATAEKGGDIGIKMAYELTSEIPDEAARGKVIALAKGSFSEIVKVNEAWVFFRSEDDPHPVDTLDSEVVQKIHSYITEFERGRVEDWFIKEADSLVALTQSVGFDDAVMEKGLEKKTFGPVPLNFGSQELLRPLDSSVPELSGAVSNENFWQTAFSTPLNAPSKPFVVGDNVLVLYPVEENDADKEVTDYIESSYSSYWISYIMEQKLHSYFIGNGKLKDNFTDIYFKYLQPSIE
jgi:hypothetical protein